jgi:hypothetical protein
LIEDKPLEELSSVELKQVPDEALDSVELDRASRELNFGELNNASAEELSADGATSGAISSGSQKDLYLAPLYHFDAQSERAYRPNRALRTWYSWGLILIPLGVILLSVGLGMFFFARFFFTAAQTAGS